MKRTVRLGDASDEQQELIMDQLAASFKTEEPLEYVLGVLYPECLARVLVAAHGIDLFKRNVVP